MALIDPEIGYYPQALNGDTYDAVKTLMVGPGYGSLANSLHLAISDPMGDLPQAGQRVYGSGPPPDIYFLTAYSAVPIADAIRGFYEASDLETPSIQSIRANRLQAVQYNHHPPTSEHLAEVERLRGLLESKEHACVVDQFYQSGTTVAYASKLLIQAGTPMLSSICGKWYEGIPSKRVDEEIDIENMTSIHADFMREVGRLAAHFNIVI